jgi:hypothetical protein
LSPPIKKHLHTGDLIKIEESHFLVLTPACDIVYNYKDDDKGNKVQFRKADKMILASVKEFNYPVLCANKNNNGIKKDELKKYVKNEYYRYHYLPPFNNENGYLIDFQDLSSIPFDVQHSREATISAPFIKDIISRFSNYYSRQGQPTFSQDSLVDKFIDSFEATKIKS